jgi:hypothetical protein
MERARRILDLCYMTSGITCDSGKDIDIRYHRGNLNSSLRLKGSDAAPSENVCVGTRLDC